MKHNYSTQLPQLPIIAGVEFRLLDKFPGYAVSDDGRLWSCRHCCHWKKEAPFVDTWTVRKCLPRDDGYVNVHLTISGTITHTYLHILIAEAFLGSIPEGHEVAHHPDNNRANNAIANLKILPHKENMQHLQEHGTLRTGDKNHNTKMTEEVVREIRRLHKEGVSIRQLSRSTGLDRSTISDAITGKTWKHVT